MREQIGECTNCQKLVYCLNGFLDGVSWNGQLYCFTCFEKHEGQPPS